MWLNVLKRSCNLKLISKGSAENAEVPNNHTKCRSNLEFRNNHFKKLILVYKNDGEHPRYKVIFELLHGHYHKCVNLDVGNRKETVTYFTKGYIISE